MQSWFALSPAPVLPAMWLAYWGLLVGWGLVLAWLALALVTRLGPSVALRMRLGLAVAVFASNLLPAPLSPAYWLGLAFQAPSLALVAIALCGLWARSLPQGLPRQAGAGALSGAADVARLSKARDLGAAFACMWSAAGVLLGWVLLLDTLAFWPRSVYALGFGAGALACVALLLAVGAVRWPTPSAWMLCAVLLVFALSRLPNGNLWNALLDPLLWAGLHIQLLRAACRAMRDKAGDKP